MRCGTHHMGPGQLVVPGLLFAVPEHPEKTQAEDREGNELTEGLAKDSAPEARFLAIRAGDAHRHRHLAERLTARADHPDVVGITERQPGRDPHHLAPREPESPVPRPPARP